jgi:hypothetical protein
MTASQLFDGENCPMTNIPLKGLFNAIGGVAIMALVAGVGLAWAFRSNSGGPFSDVLRTISAVGSVTLALVGGGLLVAAVWLRGLRSGGGF